MRIFTYLILYILLGCCLLAFFAMFIDIDMAYNDYRRFSERGDYEQQITGCFFDWVCEKYTKELQK